MITTLGIVLALVLSLFLPRPVKARMEDFVVLVGVLIFVGWLSPMEHIVNSILSGLVGIALFDVGLFVYRKTAHFRRRNMNRSVALVERVIPILKNSDDPLDAYKTIAKATRWYGVGVPQIDVKTWSRVRTVRFEDTRFGRPFFSVPEEIVISIEPNQPATTPDLSVN